MRVRLRMSRWCTGAVSLLALAACAEEPPAPEPAPRPVTVLELGETDPVEPLKLTGSVKSWKEQDIAFQVSGVVTFIVEPGQNLTGRWVEGGKVVAQGDVLARLDPREYEIARDTAKASVAVAEEQVELGKVVLTKVLPANVLAAKANRDRAEAEYQRVKAAHDRKAVSEVDLIRAVASRDKSQAELDQAEAEIEAKKTEIVSLLANVDKAKLELSSAELDLQRCTLYAPFDGEVSSVSIEAGGYAHAGETVAHLVMMDPIKVDLALSPGTANSLRILERVLVYPPNVDHAMPSWVYEKATIADPDTRTFRVSILGRNTRRLGSLAPDDPLRQLPRASTYTYLVPDDAERRDVWMVEERRALRKDAQGWFVWGSNEVKRDGTLDAARPVVSPRRFRVTPGEKRVNFQGLFVFRVLADLGDLTPDTLIVYDVPDDFEEGGQMLLSRGDWALYPGQIVPVLLDTDEPMPGLYVPMNVVRPSDETTGQVFVVSDGTVHAVHVKILSKVGGLARIEGQGEDAGLVAPGAKIIADYIHFLVDGERVQVIGTRKSQP